MALLGVVACGSGDGQTVARPTADVATTRPQATLGLTPLEQSTVATDATDSPDSLDPVDTLGTVPGLETDTTTTAAGPTSLDPWALPKPDPAPIPAAFEARNQIGSLEIPAISVAQNLFEGVTLKTLDNGPGHWPGSALPGQTGNVVIAGHRVSQTHPFRDLDKLSVGDEVIFSTAQGRNVYLVTKTQIVNPDALWIVDQTPEKTATLFACHPKGSTDQRIVVFLAYAPERSEPAA